IPRVTCLQQGITCLPDMVRPTQGKRKTCPYYTKKLQVAVYEDGHIAVNSRGHRALHPVGGNWQKTIKPPPEECAVAGDVDCGSHILDASALWCDYSCLPQSHYSSASAESQKRPEFLAASCERQ